MSQLQAVLWPLASCPAQCILFLAQQGHREPSGREPEVSRVPSLPRTGAGPRTSLGSSGTRKRLQRHPEQPPLHLPDAPFPFPSSYGVSAVVPQSSCCRLSHALILKPPSSFPFPFPFPPPQRKSPHQAILMVRQCFRQTRPFLVLIQPPIPIHLDSDLNSPTCHLIATRGAQSKI